MEVADLGLCIIHFWPLLIIFQEIPMLADPYPKEHHIY